MTKKHYWMIARLLRDNAKNLKQRVELAKAFAEKFALDNPRFKRATFLNAVMDTDIYKD